MDNRIYRVVEERKFGRPGSDARILFSSVSLEACINTKYLLLRKGTFSHDRLSITGLIPPEFGEGIYGRHC